MEFETKVFLVVAAVLALGFSGCLAGCVSGCDRGYSEGERTGTVVKLSHKGVFCKTWEGTMNLGGTDVDSSGKLVPQTWDFTVVDPAFLGPVQEAQRSGKPVTITYVQWVVSPLFRMGSDYEAIGVKR